MASPVNVDTDVLTARHIGPSTISAFGQQLPEVLAPFTAETGSVENFTSDLNVVFSSLLDSIARLTTRAIKEV